MSARKAIIIGAGVGGLATAALLAKAGYSVEIYEGRAIAGGRAGLKESQGYRFDTGPSWYLMPEVYEHFFGLLGEKIEDHLELVKLSPAYKVFYDYREPITVTGDMDIDAATFEAVEAGAGQALKKYVANAEHTYAKAKDHFLYNPFSDIRSLTKPEILRGSAELVSLLTQSLDRYVSARFHSLALRQILEYSAVFLGTSPFQAPAMYHLMSYLDFKQGVYYPQGGLYEIVRSLQRIAIKQGVGLNLSAPVTEIMTENGTATGVRLADGRQVEADLVISNADLHHTETELLPADSRSYPESFWAKKTVGPSALLLYVGVKGPMPQLAHHNLLFTEKWRDNFSDIFDKRQWPADPSLYVCRPGATDPSVAPDGMENLFVLVPLPAGVSKSGTETEAYADRCLDLIAEHCGIADLRSQIAFRESYGTEDFEQQLHAWQGTALGMAHTLRQSAFFRPSNRSKKLSNLYYVGGDIQPGVGLPMCLISAELVYKRLSDDRSGGPVDAIEPIGEAA